MFSVSITHNSKIRELSNGNRVMGIELSFAKRILSYGSHHFWVMGYGNWELSYGNRPFKQPLSFAFLPTFFSSLHVLGAVWIGNSHHSILSFHNSILKNGGTHLNSKKKLVWQAITQFPIFCFHHSILWFLSYELWKLKTHFDCFQFP